MTSWLGQHPWIAPVVGSAIGFYCGLFLGGWMRAGKEREIATTSHLNGYRAGWAARRQYPPRRIPSEGPEWSELNPRDLN